MDVKHFTANLSKRVYPRYIFCSQLFKRIRDLMEQCALDKYFTNPNFQEVHIYITSFDESDIIDEELIEIECDIVICEKIRCQNLDELKETTVGKTCVFIYSYEQALKHNTCTWEYLGHAFIFVTDLGISQKASISAGKKLRSEFVNIVTRSNLSSELDATLERLVFDSLDPRIKILEACCQVELKQAQTIFATVNQCTEISLYNRINKFPSTTINGMVWLENKMEVIKNKMIEVYGKHGAEITQVLLGCHLTSEMPDNIYRATLPDHEPTNGTGIVENELQRLDVIVSTLFKHLTGISENRSRIQKCCSQYGDLLRQRNAPKKERLKQQHVPREIFSVNGVYGGGFESSILRIDIADTLNDEEKAHTEHDLREILRNNGIQNYDIRFGPRDIKYYVDLTNALQKETFRDNTYKSQVEGGAKEEAVNCLKYIQKNRNKIARFDCEILYQRNLDAEPAISYSSMNQITEQILEVNGVTDCRYHLQTLQIFLDKDLGEQERKRSENVLRTIIERNGIQSYEFYLERRNNGVTPLPPI